VTFAQPQPGGEPRKRSGSRPTSAMTAHTSSWRCAASSGTAGKPDAVVMDREGRGSSPTRPRCIASSTWGGSFKSRGPLNVVRSTAKTVPAILQAGDVAAGARTFSPRPATADAASSPSSRTSAGAKAYYEDIKAGRPSAKGAHAGGVQDPVRPSQPILRPDLVRRRREKQGGPHTRSCQLEGRPGHSLGATSTFDLSQIGLDELMAHRDRGRRLPADAGPGYRTLTGELLTPAGGGAGATDRAWGLPGRWSVRAGRGGRSDGGLRSTRSAATGSCCRRSTLRGGDRGIRRPSWWPELQRRGPPTGGTTAGNHGRRDHLMQER